MSSSTPLLYLEDVEVRYPAPSTDRWGQSAQIRALREIRLAVGRGEAVGLVGESGCGKSTLGRTALLLQRPHKGRVFFDDIDLLNLKPGALRRLRSRMQMVFQDPQASLNPRMTAGQLVAEPFRIHNPKASRKTVAERVENLLTQVRLDASAADKYPHQFSGGQRQRIAIARSLSCDPDLIVADEPTSALDVSVQAQTLNLLMDLQEKRNLAFLFISHNLQVVKLFCPTLAIMYLGEIVEVGPTAEVCGRPAHPYTEALLSAAPVVGRTDIPVPLEGDLPSPIELPRGCIFHPRCPEKDKPERCLVAPARLRKINSNRWGACHLASSRLARA